MLKESIINFPKQFSWEPSIVNENNLTRKNNTIVVGMGSSHLGTDLIKNLLPSLALTIHSDYGLPEISKNSLEDSLIILSSYSGNTEEIIDSFNEALKQKLSMAVVTTGGQLLELAIKNNKPYVQMPAENIQPRLALGYSFRSILKILDETSLLGESDSLASTLNIESLRGVGEELGKKLINKIPVIYSSLQNKALARIWKIKLNETSKIPAFFNTLPELNHNEMAGFDTKEKTASIMEKFHFVFLQNKDEDSRIAKRMGATKNILEQQGFSVDVLLVEGNTKTDRVFNSLIIADWLSLYLAEAYGNNPEEVPLVEKFKKIISA